MSRIARAAVLGLFVFAGLSERAEAQVFPIPHAPVFAFVDANRPSTLAYTPTNTRRSGLTGPVSVTRDTHPGRYVVHFGSIARADGGNFQVHAYGSSDAFCTIAWPGDSNIEKTLSVICFNGQGDFVDTKFTASYSIYGVGFPLETNVGYAMVAPDGTLDADNLRTYTSSDELGVNPDRTGKGTYTVQFFDLVSDTPNFRVTPYSWGSVYCNLTGITGNLAGIACFNSDGLPTDTWFSIAYDNRNTFYGLTEAHGLIDSLHTGDELYVYTEGATTSPGAHVVGFKHWNTNGQYTVFFTNIASPTSLGIPYVVANSDGSADYLNRRCKVVSWQREPNPPNAPINVSVRVDCALPNGTPINSDFSINYMR